MTTELQSTATIVSKKLRQKNYPIRTVNVPKLLLQNISLTLKPVPSVNETHNNNKMNYYLAIIGFSFGFTFLNKYQLTSLSFLIRVKNCSFAIVKLADSSV